MARGGEEARELDHAPWTQVVSDEVSEHVAIVLLDLCFGTRRCFMNNGKESAKRGGLGQTLPEGVCKKDWVLLAWSGLVQDQADRQMKDNKRRGMHTRQGSGYKMQNRTSTLLTPRAKAWCKDLRDSSVKDPGAYPSRVLDIARG